MESPFPNKDHCRLRVLVKPGEQPIQCRRRVWEQDPGSGVCMDCHPKGREMFIESVIRRYFASRPL